MDPKRKAEILSGIKDPKVRAHYEAQLDMQDELEAEGDLSPGGIFSIPGREGDRIAFGMDEARIGDDVPIIEEVVVPPAVAARAHAKAARVHADAAVRQANVAIVCAVIAIVAAVVALALRGCS